MKVKQGHTIEKLIFDIQIPNEHLFKQIADLISGITEYELIQILESLLDKYSIQNQTISIAEIELDLGNISVADTRNQWITHFKMSLEKWLVEKFVGNNLPVDEQIKSFSLSERDFNLITYFITYGKIPWWGLNPPFIPDDTLKKYIREERIKTKDLIFTLGKIPTSRKRIIYQFKDDTLYQLFGILSPKPSSFFKDYATDLTEIHQKQKVVEEEDRAFKKVLQELILTYLISHTATSIDQTSFFKNQLLLLSKQYGISYKTLLDRIDEAIKTLPETYPQKFGIKSMVRELLQRDFRNVSLPKSSGNIGFSEYSELLTLFYTEKPHQITGKYHSKRERDRLIRVMIKRNKKKTFLILAEIHRKLKINKIQSAALFSESLLLEMMEIWQPSEVKLTVPLIDSFNFLHQNFFLFSGSNISVPGIIYSHFLAHSFTEKRSEVVPASRIIKSIAKSFNLNTEFLLKQLFSASKSDHPKLKNQIFQILNKEKQLILGAPADKIPDLPQLKNILAALLGTHFSLFEELIKKVSTLYPTLNSFVKQPTAYVLFIQNWMDEPKRSEHFPNFIHDLILLLSQRIPGEADDLQKSLLTQKSSYSPKLFSVIQSAFKTKTQLSKQEARNLFSDPEYITKLDLPQLKNILAALLDTHFSLFEELIKKVSALYPTLNSFVKQPAFYLFLIDIIRVSPSNAYKMDLFFLKVISRLANKSKVPIKVFLSPFLVTKSVIPDKLINTLRVVYETVQEKYPTYTETVEMPVKAAESMGKLIEILGAEFFETISPSEHADKTSLFLEALVLDKNLVLEKLYDHKFNPNIPALLVYGLTDEALQLLQMSITGTFYHELIRASKDIMTWISRFNIIKLPRKKIGLWIKQQTLSYILLKESSPFQVDEYVQFILEKMQKERMLQLKELEKTLDQLSSPLQNEVKRLIIEKNKMPIPKARRDQQFFSDILIHYLITGKIQSWLSTPYLEIKELEYTFKQALTSENVALVKGILAIPMNLNIFNRLRALLGQNEPLILIQLIHKIFPERSLLSFYLSVTKMAIGLNISPDMSESVFRVFMQKKLWTINNQILRFELMRDGLNEQYKVDITLGEINIKGQAFSLSWFEYYVESGFWPEGFPEEQMNQYLDFLKLRILENPLLLLQITGKTSFHSFHQVILRRIFSVRELASIFKKIIPIKNISAPILTQIIEEYLAKGTKYLQKNNLDLVLDSILNLLLFERKEHSPVEQQLSQDLSGILPEIKPLGKSNAKYPVSTGTEKDFDLLDYYLTYGSLPIDYPYFDSKDWQSILENLKIKAPGTLQDQLYIWSKTPYKLNRLLELVSEEVAIALISMVNKALYEQITLLEKSVESVMGEKMRLKIGIRDEKALVRQILLLWGKNQKMQASPIPVLYRYFSLFLERKRLQPTLILALIVEKLKNVPSKQIHVLKSLQKYGRDTRTETVIKKEKPTTPEGMPQDAIYIANAGLVLLWPFLGRFFRRLNLVGTKEFIDEASLMRGILLTQYLVSGKKEAPEYELALNKLLCGAAMDLEIDSEIDITEEEINLSDSLLTGAITNWDKLKGTRINTFRETFLQRNGYLYYMNNRWELKVEKKAYDLLLETLPWGIQMIQMSWMKERLVVLWR
jgi:hypothetical protein